MVQKINISVIIPAYNAESTIEMCLNALQQQDIKEPFEIIVVDSSQDATPQIIAQKFPEVKLLHFEQRTNHALARNIGLSEAQGELICLVDSDCTTPTGWLTRMAEAHKLPGISVVGGPVLNGNPETAVSWAGYMLEFNNLLLQEEAQLVTHVGTGNVSYKREIFNNHSFKHDAAIYAHVDLYFHWRLHKEGIKILSDPNIYVHHYHRSTMRSYLRHQYKIGRGTIQVLKRTDLRGSYFAKHQVLSLMILPMFPIIKFFRTSYLMVRYKKSLAWEKPLIFPAFIIGLIPWIVGFAIELLNFHDQPWKVPNSVDILPEK